MTPTSLRSIPSLQFPHNLALARVAQVVLKLLEENKFWGISGSLISLGKQKTKKKKLKIMGKSPSTQLCTL